jgi:hypothetical protein
MLMVGRLQVRRALRDTAMSLPCDRLLRLRMSEVAAWPGGDYMPSIRRAGHPIAQAFRQTREA